MFRHNEKEFDRLNRTNQAYFLEFSEIALNVCQCLLRIHFVLSGDPIREFLRRMPLFE